MPEEYIRQLVLDMKQDLEDVKTEMKCITESLIRLESKSISTQDYYSLSRKVDKHAVYFTIFGVVLVVFAIPVFLICFEFIMGKL